MFKRVKKHNGVREIYLGRRKIFYYVNIVKFAEFVETQLNANLELSITRNWGGGGTPLLMRI